jgi:hypothetical protein
LEELKGISLPEAGVCVFEGAGGVEPVVLVGCTAEDVGVTAGERESGVVEAEYGIVKRELILVRISRFGVTERS